MTGEEIVTRLLVECGSPERMAVYEEEISRDYAESTGQPYTPGLLRRSVEEAVLSLLLAERLQREVATRSFLYVMEHLKTWGSLMRECA